MKCERGRTDGRAELMLLKEERMDDRLKRAAGMGGRKILRSDFVSRVDAWGLSIEIHSSRGSMHLRESSSTCTVSGMS